MFYFLLKVKKKIHLDFSHSQTDCPGKISTWTCKLICLMTGCSIEKLIANTVIPQHLLDHSQSSNTLDGGMKKSHIAGVHYFSSAI